MSSSHSPVNPALEARVQTLGSQVLAAAQRAEAARSIGDRWIATLLERSMESERFRVQALRFVDVLPALQEDAELVRLLAEYFDDDELPLPGMARWGLSRVGSSVAPALVAKAVRRGAELLAQRFLGGRGADQVLKTVESLYQRGYLCSLDRLGEAVVSEAEADAYLQAYLQLMDSAKERLGEVPSNDLNLSVKLSSLYSLASPQNLEGSVQGVLSRLRPLLRAARERGYSVCLDMEQYELKALTLSTLRQVLMEPDFRDWRGLGVALQAYLKDAETDLAELADWATARGTPVTVRLVRGAYWDQETVLAAQQGWPVPVWTGKAATDGCFERCLTRLMAASRVLRPAIATHNVRSLALTLALAEQNGLTASDLEFQMLHGMGLGLHEAVASLGQRVRVYMPFGELLPGMAYLVRRLLENSSSQSFLSMGRVPQGSASELLAAVTASSDSEHVSGASGNQIGFSNEPVRRFTASGEREAFGEALRRVRAELGRRYSLVIGGRETTTGRVMVSHNPAYPDEVVGEVAAAGEGEAEAAVKAATEALPSWRAAPAAERAGLLRRVATLLRERRDEFSALEVYEAGKNWPEADADVCEAVDFLEYYAQQAVRLGAGMQLDTYGETNAYDYVPRGVGVIIPPWNFPLAILAGMLSAAVVTGNTAVLKPSSQTPVVAAWFVALIREAGMPAGVVNFVPGEGRSVGEYLVCHPGIHFVAFTGSVSVGTRINRLAAELRPGQHHVKRVIAEMGGKNAIIVDASADMDAAVLGTLASAFGYQGQKCSACSRAIVVGGAYEGFVDRLLAGAASLPVGPPEDPATVVGPVIEAAARDRIGEAVMAAKASARLLMQRDVSHLSPGYYVGPAIFGEVPSSCALAQEEIFGPVLAVMRASDFGEALTIANGTRYALTGGLYSRSPASVARARAGFQVGNLYINRKITGAVVGRQPFGGFRLSGVGSKAGGPDYLLQFVEPRTATENTLRRGYAPSLEVARGAVRQES
ncbi:MAG: L-glutamate gamma-semialdehyde dehydrogenase [Gammaproteobacteria bacterium]|nr:L-glutamate gamma-semialdehyde dehydrogenase [Gammaproteobacteria bacterium]